MEQKDVEDVEIQRTVNSKEKAWAERKGKESVSKKRSREERGNRWWKLLCRVEHAVAEVMVSFLIECITS